MSVVQYEHNECDEEEHSHDASEDQAGNFSMCHSS